MKKLIFIFTFCALNWGIYAQTYWGLSGNAGTSTSNFFGTTDCTPLIFKTRDVERMRLLQNQSSLGIGISNPQATLHLHCQVDSPTCDGNGENSILENGDDGGNTDGPSITTRYLLRLTTPETGIKRGFSASYSIGEFSANLHFYQLEPQSSFMIKVPAGGLTIAPTGSIGIGTDVPQAKLDVDGSFKALSANITNALFANTLNANNANITNTLSANILKANSANINGKIKAKEVEVTLSGWPDYVFAKDYNLMPISEVEQFIIENQHLPGVPPAEEVEANGVNLGEINLILVQKVEELTLYIIQLQKQIDELKHPKGGQ